MPEKFSEMDKIEMQDNRMGNDLDAVKRSAEQNEQTGETITGMDVLANDAAAEDKIRESRKSEEHTALIDAAFSHDPKETTMGILHEDALKDDSPYKQV